MHLFNNLRFFGPNMNKNTKENKFKMRLSMEENVFLFLVSILLKGIAKVDSKILYNKRGIFGM